MIRFLAILLLAGPCFGAYTEVIRANWTQGIYPDLGIYIGASDNSAFSTGTSAAWTVGVSTGSLALTSSVTCANLPYVANTTRLTAYQQLNTGGTTAGVFYFAYVSGVMTSCSGSTITILTDNSVVTPFGTGPYCDAHLGTCTFTSGWFITYETNPYSVQYCADDPTFSSGNCQTVAATGIRHPTTYNVALNLSTEPCPISCQGPFINIGTTPTWGSVNLKDGNAHLIYARIQSVANPGTFFTVDGFQGGYPFKWNAGASQMDLKYAPVLESSPTPLSKTALGVIVNLSDTYSTGTNTGNAVCTCPNATSLASTSQCGTVGAGLANTIYDNGAPGYYVSASGHNMACSNMYAVSFSGASTSITLASLATALSMITSLPGSIQALALGWNQPSIVTGTGNQHTQSISSVFATGTMQSDIGLATCGAFFNIGPNNPMFNTTSLTPWTTYAIRPTMLLAGESCAGCTTSINYTAPAVWSSDVAQFQATVNAAVAAIGSNPSIVSSKCMQADGTRAYCTYYSNLLYTNGITVGTRTAAVSQLGTPASPTSANVSSGGLFLQNGSAHWNYNAGATGMAGASFAMSLTSTSGQTIMDNAQTNAASWLSNSAPGGMSQFSVRYAGSYGIATEPCNMFGWKAPDMGVFLANYIGGKTLVESGWRAIPQPWLGNFFGDPLAQPFTSQGHGLFPMPISIGVVF